MKLVTQEIRKSLPPIKSTEGLMGDAIARVKFFNPQGAGTWYGVEFDGENEFYGLADLQEVELGYFWLSDMQSFRGKLGLANERDMYITPRPLRELPEWSRGPGRFSGEEE
ncbi:MAG: DUF2958 domain-containing protein [Solirubrobacteraceae bacterium]